MKSHESEDAKYIDETSGMSSGITSTLFAQNTESLSDDLYNYKDNNIFTLFTY